MISALLWQTSNRISEVYLRASFLLDAPVQSGSGASAGEILVSSFILGTRQQIKAECSGPGSYGFTQPDPVGVTS